MKKETIIRIIEWTILSLMVSIPLILSYSISDIKTVVPVKKKEYIQWDTTKTPDWMVQYNTK